MANETELIEVYRSNGPLAAEVVKSKLESAGIPAMLKYESAGRTFGFTVEALGAVSVLVKNKDEKIARELLKSN